MRDNKKTTGIYLKYESVLRSVRVCFQPRACEVKSLALLHRLIYATNKAFATSVYLLELLRRR